MSNIYVGTMGMIAHQNKLNVIGNNISNARTTGFKKDVDTIKVFEESFLRSLKENNRIGSYQNMAQTDEVYTNFEQGSLEYTKGPLDLVINDRNGNELENRMYSFFEVEENGNTYLTKDGSFTLDVDGNLSTRDGSFVLGDDGERINLLGVGDVHINGVGEITNASTGELIASLSLRTVPEENTNFLEKVGHTKYRVMVLEDLVRSFGPLDGIIDNFETNRSLREVIRNLNVIESAVETGQIDIFAEDFSGEIGQGMLESSNVEISKEMTNLLIAQNGFSSSAKAFEVMDKILEQEVNTIGS